MNGSEKRERAFSHTSDDYPIIVPRGRWKKGRRERGEREKNENNIQDILAAMPLT